jgi:hypothetical protein
MKINIQGKQILLVCLALVLLTGCAAAETANPEPTFTPLPPTSIPEPTVTPLPPTATLEPRSCEDVDGNCIDVSFDGEECTYSGPEFVQPGPVMFVYHNQSGGVTGMVLGRLEEGKTWDDVLDGLGPPGTERTVVLPFLIWMMELETQSGESSAQEMDITAGTYYWVCYKDAWPIPVWAGATLIVEN